MGGGAGESSGFLYLLTSLRLSLPFPTVCDDGGPFSLDAQKKTPMTVLGSPHTLKPLKPPFLATQGKSWRKRRKVRCPSSDGMLHGTAGWGPPRVSCHRIIPVLEGGDCKFI